MASIRRWGLFTGGAAAGLFLAVSGVALARLVILPELGADGAEGYAPDLITPLLLRIAAGFVVVWVYVGFRPRFGAGPRSIIGAALAVWAPTSIVVMSVAALFPILSPLTVSLLVVWSLVELTAASFAGAALYRRHAAATMRKRGHGVDTAPS